MGVCVLVPWSIATACSETDCDLTQSCGVPSGAHLGGTGSLGDSGDATSEGIAGASGHGATVTARGGAGEDDPGPAGTSGLSGSTGCAQDPCGCDGWCPDDGWTTPILLENNDAKGFENPKIGVGPKGDLVVAWQRDRTEAGGVWLNTYDPEQSIWRGAFDALGGDKYDSTGEPQVVFGPGQDALVYYRYQPSSNNGSRDMRVHRFTPEPYGWSALPITATGQGGWNHRIAQNANGRAAALYRFIDEVSYSLVSHYDPTAKTWSPWEMLTPSSSVYTTRALIAIGDSGRITYLWQYYQPGDQSIYAKTHDPNDGWGSVQLLDSGDYAVLAGMSYASDGSALGAWLRRSTPNAPRTVEVSWLSPSSGTWGSRITISDAAVDVAASSVTLDRSGNAIAVWTDVMDDELWIQARRYDVGTKKWSDPVTLRREGAAGPPQLMTDDAGNAVAAWESRIGDIGHLYATSYDVSTDRWTKPTRIDEGAGGTGDLHLSVGQDGAAYAVWEQDSAGKKSIWFSMRPPK